MPYELSDFANFSLSVAMTAQDDTTLGEHVHKGPKQEDLTFAYWRPSVGEARFTSVVTDLVLPEDGDRILQGNVAFLPQYLHRVLAGVPDGSGIALLHGHPHSGWQGLSVDDTVAERDRLAGAVAGRTGLPLLGLTRGTDGAWGGRFWLRDAPRSYRKRPARSVRVVGSELGITYHPDEPSVRVQDSQAATLSVWGQAAQERIVRARIGIVGLGSVGSLVAEALSRIGLRNLTYIDFDKIEVRNLDRTVGATRDDIGHRKVDVAADNTYRSATARNLDLRVVPHNARTPKGLAAMLDCDALICCVDRWLPRDLLNNLAYSHLIPVVDGGIFASVRSDGKPQHVTWRIHTIGPGRACMVCLGSLRRDDVSLEQTGKLDSPDYIAGMSEEARDAIARRNVFPFSMSVAAHEVLQLIGLVAGLPRIGGTGPQKYDAYPGKMEILGGSCESECEFAALTATAIDLTPNLMPEPQSS